MSEQSPSIYPAPNPVILCGGTPVGSESLQFTSIVCVCGMLGFWIFFVVVVIVSFKLWPEIVDCPILVEKIKLFS